jgi:serine/threonine-protein kinase
VRQRADWPFESQDDLAPAQYLARVGRIFATFDSRTQDSGNVSFGLEAAGRRWFVKTAGDPTDRSSFLDHAARVELLRNAQRVAASVSHPALPPLCGELASAWGPMLVYDWAPGELLGGTAQSRADPASAHQRFRRLPAVEVTAALQVVLEAHIALCAARWVACDFYDGAMIYDFEARRMWLVDLDTYHRGSFVNDMGRMFGSTRFMAPEELERGAAIDERTTVFTLGRAVSVFLGDGTLEPGAFRGSPAQLAAMTRACSPDPAERFGSVGARRGLARLRRQPGWMVGRGDGAGARRAVRCLRRAAPLPCSRGRRRGASGASARRR